MRWTHALAVLLIVALVAACGGPGTGDDGGDGGDGGEQSQGTGNGDGGDGGGEPSQDTGNGDGGDGGDGGNGSGSLDVDRVYEILTPPNATELSKTTTAGVIFAAFESDESFDSLRSFYEGAIGEAGLQIISTTEAQGGVAWVISQDDTGNFGGSVSLFPASDGSGTQITVTVGEGGG